MTKNEEEKNQSEKCPNCGNAIIEEECTYSGSPYLVTICTACSFFDWIVPKDIEPETEEFEQNKKWVQIKAEELRIKHHIADIPIQFTEDAQNFNTTELRYMLNCTAKFVNCDKISVHKYQDGMKVEFSHKK